jgi:tRNA (Thr-GGU) A37 N-methylase
MFTPKAIGFVRSPYRESAGIPKGLGARHDAVGALEKNLSQLQDSRILHLFVIWAFNRRGSIVGSAPIDHKVHGVFARSPRRPNPIALTVVGC